MKRKIITLIVLGLVLFVCLLTGWHVGMKVYRRTSLRRTAMTAYGNRDYAQAERLLQQYVQADPNAEAEYVALANIYHEFGNVEQESQMWQMASSLNPENPVYRANMLNSMVKSASYAPLHGVLGRKAKVDEKFTDQELFLYVISSYRSGYPKDGDDAYKKYLEIAPEVFHGSELGRMAEFMATYETLSDGDREVYLSGAMQSEDPDIRFEAIYTAIRRMEQRNDDDSEGVEEMERLLKRAVETNYFAGTVLLADFYFSECRFAEVIDILEPYLKTVDDIDLYLLYAESCVFTGRLDELRALVKKLQQKSDSMMLLAEYCEILTAYLENDEKKLAAIVRKSGRNINSPLARFVRLRVAMGNESFNEILTVAQEIFSNPPFHDLHNRALFICLDYIAKEMKKQENRDDPSQIAALARILSGYLHGNRLLTEIILTDQYKSGLVKEESLMNALGKFPDDALLQRITAEFLIFDENAEQALPIIEQVLKDKKAANQQPDRGIQVLLMLALDQTGRHDEAATVFRELVENSDFDMELELLGQFFHFCLDNARTADLVSMADRLDNSTDDNLKRFGGGFRAAALLLTEDKARENEALDLLVSTPADAPEFTFYAANRLYQHGRLDEAEAKYKTILKTYRTPSLPYVNLSDIYHARGEKQKALEAAKTAFDLDRESMLPAFTYAKRLAEAERYEEAVEALHFPRHALNYREDIVDLWRDCMRHVIEKSFADRKFLQAEEQCKHMLLIVPDDEFAKENLKKVRKILFPEKPGTELSADAAEAASPADYTPRR